MAPNVNDIKTGGDVLINLTTHVPPTSPFSVVDGHRMSRKPSHSNELPDGFLNRSRWLVSLQENILQRGQHLCRPFPVSEDLQRGRDASDERLRYVQRLHRSKRAKKLDPLSVLHVVLPLRLRRSTFVDSEALQGRERGQGQAADVRER